MIRLADFGPEINTCFRIIAVCRGGFVTRGELRSGMSVFYLNDRHYWVFRDEVWTICDNRHNGKV